MRKIKGEIGVNPAQSDHKWRQRLQAMLDDIQAEDALGQDGQATVTLDQQSVGRLSRMDALQQQAMAKATAGRRAAQVQRIKAALKRLDEGEFGYCADCGEDIAPARVELDPTALKCLDCARG